MTSEKRKWIIEKIANRARRSIDTLTLEIKEEVIKRFECLERNPFEDDIKKISGKKNFYRGRIGEYRYYFRTFPESRSIEILLFEYRSDIKRKTVQRLKYKR